MEKQSMTIHRALSELKVIDKRISKNIQSLVPIGAVRKDGLVNNYYNQRDFEDNAKSEFQSVKDLIKRKESIKSAIVKSNSETTVTVGGKTMTVSDAITMKSSIALREELLRKLKSSFAEVKSTVDEVNERVEANAMRLAENALGKDNVKTSDKEAESIINTYKASNSVSVVDPLKIDDLIKALSEEVENFQGEVDAVLSESNAITTIEV